MAQAGTGAAEAGQDEDEVTGVVGAMRQYEPFRSPQVCDMRCQVRDPVGHVLIILLHSLKSPYQK